MFIFAAVLYIVAAVFSCFISDSTSGIRAGVGERIQVGVADTADRLAKAIKWVHQSKPVYSRLGRGVIDGESGE